MTCVWPALKGCRITTKVSAIPEHYEAHGAPGMAPPDPDKIQNLIWYTTLLLVLARLNMLKYCHVPDQTSNSSLLAWSTELVRVTRTGRIRGELAASDMTLQLLISITR